MFRKVLIANRGEIAVRIARTCHAMGLSTVAIYADPDRDAPFVRLADEAIYLGPPVASGSFLAGEKILDAGLACGVDAVHPGYGFLAENADFAAACIARGITFVGPSPAVIESMGNKTTAKAVAVDAGVPVVPGFDARNMDEAAIVAHCEKVGFPVLLKAAYGGGGKGMRIVERSADVPAAVAAAKREALAAFGRDDLLVERYVERPRHVEVQILGDHHGNLVHLFERECSIQRRHQKVVEEAPSPTIRPETRQRLTEAAVALGRALGYVNAGTVEFIVGADESFYFLEVNTRLQVEHPVTEAILGLDLVRLQLDIAAHRPLPFRQEDLVPRGHAIEVRLCAEDPRVDHLPAIGSVHRWQPALEPGVRFDSGIAAGSAVTIHYDSMLAKVIAHGPTRDEAARKLSRALSGTVVQGLRTNAEFLARLLDTPSFRAAELDTSFLARHPELTQPVADQPDIDRVHAVAAALWQQAQHRRAADVLSTLPSGWRNNPAVHQRVQFSGDAGDIEVAYRHLGRQRFALQVEGLEADTAEILEVGADHLLACIGSVRRAYHLLQHGDVVEVHSSRGRSTLGEHPRFPDRALEKVAGSCQASMPGRILSVRVTVDQPVERGAVLLTMEAMKMEHDIVAPHAGIVREVRVAQGDQVDAGAVLVVLDESDTATPT